MHKVIVKDTTEIMILFTFPIYLEMLHAVNSFHPLLLPLVSTVEKFPYRPTNSIFLQKIKEQKHLHIMPDYNYSRIEQLGIYSLMEFNKSMVNNSILYAMSIMTHHTATEETF